MKFGTYIVTAIAFLLVGCSSAPQYLYPEGANLSYVTGVATRQGVALPVGIDGTEIASNTNFNTVPSVVKNPVPVTAGLHDVTFLYRLGNKGALNTYSMVTKSGVTYYPKFDAEIEENAISADIPKEVTMWVSDTKGNVVSEKNKLTIINIK